MTKKSDLFKKDSPVQTHRKQWGPTWTKYPKPEEFVILREIIYECGQT
jgi:hypothetical protein